MLRWPALAVTVSVLALVLAPGAGLAQTTVGYDALGRLKCVKQAGGAYTLYAYDAAGNRTARTVNSNPGSCTSQAVGSAPVAPVTLTATNPAVSVASQSSTNFAIGTLGSAGDSASLTLVSVAASGALGACGTASKTATVATYVAPLVTPSTASRLCHVDYVFAHPNGQREAGRITATVAGQ